MSTRNVDTWEDSRRGVAINSSKVGREGFELRPLAKTGERSAWTTWVTRGWSSDELHFCHFFVVGCQPLFEGWSIFGEMFHFFCFDKLRDIYCISLKIPKSPQMIAKLTNAKHQISWRHQVQQDLLQALAKSKHSVFSKTICQSAPHFPWRLGFSGTLGRPTPNGPPIPLL